MFVVLNRASSFSIIILLVLLAVDCRFTLLIKASLKTERILVLAMKSVVFNCLLVLVCNSVKPPKNYVLPVAAGEKVGMGEWQKIHFYFYFMTCCVILHNSL